MALVDLLTPGLDHLLRRISGDIPVTSHGPTWQLAPTWTPGRIGLEQDGEEIWVVIEHVAATSVACDGDTWQVMASTNSPRSAAYWVDDIVVHRRTMPVADLNERVLCDALRDTAAAADALRDQLVDRYGLGEAPYSDPRFTYWAQPDTDEQATELAAPAGYL